jgi:hypothetical protein
MILRKRCSDRMRQTRAVFLIVTCPGPDFGHIHSSLKEADSPYAGRR